MCGPQPGLNGWRNYARMRIGREYSAYPTLRTLESYITMLPPDNSNTQATAIAAAHGSSETAPLIDLRQVMSILRQRLLLIAGTTLAAVLLALTYVFVTPPVYTAQSVVLVDPREMRLTDASEVLKGIGSDSAAITSQVAVLRSRELLVPVLDQQGVFNDPEFTRGGVARDAVFEQVLRNLSVDRQGLTYVLEISFKSRDAQKAARITNAIVKAYLASQVNEKSRANADVNGLLEGQISGLRQTVAEDDASVQEFKARNGMLDVETGKTLLQSQIVLLNQQALNARERARQALNRYNQAKSLEGVPGALATNSDILSSPNADQLRSDYNQRSVDLSRLSQTYGTRHPQYVNLTSELDRIKVLMSEETGRIVRRLEGDLKIADNDVAKADADLAGLQTQADTTGQKEVELRQLQMQAQTSRDVLQQFLRRAQETSQLDNMQRSEARVLSPAVPPIAPSWPKPSLMIAVAGLMGVVGGTMMALLLGPVAPNDQSQAAPTSPGSGRRRLRFSFSKPKTSGGTTALPVLGRLRSSVAVHALADGRFPRERLLSAKLEVKEQPTSEFSLGVWSLIGKLFDVLPQKRGQHLIAFTDAGNAIEKYRLAYNMALALERLGASVLVVDLDPIDGSPIASGSDLLTVLSRHEAIERTQIIDFTTRLAVLRMAMNEPGNSAVTLDAELIEEMLAKSAGVFDFVLVNALPLRSRNRMDGLLAKASQVVLVLDEEQAKGLNATKLQKDIGRDVAAGCVVVGTPAPDDEPAIRPARQGNVTRISDPRPARRRH